MGQMEMPASGGDGSGLLRRRDGGPGNAVSLTLYARDWSVLLGGFDSNLSLKGIKAVNAAKGPLRLCPKYFL